MKLIASWTLNIATVSEANNTDHWTKKAKRRKTHNMFIRLSFSKHTNGQVATPCKIRLVRLGKRFLDVGDNLPMAFKGIRDELASLILPNMARGQADADSRIEWEYDQEKYPIPAIRIEIFKLDKALTHPGKLLLQPDDIQDEDNLPPNQDL
jgi:hypothetical protein